MMPATPNVDALQAELRRLKRGSDLLGRLYAEVSGKNPDPSQEWAWEQVEAAMVLQLPQAVDPLTLLVETLDFYRTRAEAAYHFPFDPYRPPAGVSKETAHEWRRYTCFDDSE